MNYKKLELKLRRIVERRLREGWNVRRTDSDGIRVLDYPWMVPACCLLGSIKIDDISRPSYRIIGITWDDCCSLEAGFEGWNDRGGDGRLYDIGARIYRDYVETVE